MKFRDTFAKVSRVNPNYKTYPIDSYSEMLFVMEFVPLNKSILGDRTVTFLYINTASSWKAIRRQVSTPSPLVPSTVFFTPGYR